MISLTLSKQQYHTVVSSCVFVGDIIADDTSQSNLNEGEGERLGVIIYRCSSSQTQQISLRASLWTALVEDRPLFIRRRDINGVGFPIITLWLYKKEQVKGEHKEVHKGIDEDSLGFWSAVAYCYLRCCLECSFHVCRIPRVWWWLTSEQKGDRSWWGRKSDWELCACFEVRIVVVVRAPVLYRFRCYLQICGESARQSVTRSTATRRRNSYRSLVWLIYFVSYHDEWICIRVR